MVSPTRVPPPSLEKTVRPSSASWPPRPSKASVGHHVGHARRRQDHLVAAGVERDLPSCAQSRRRQISCSISSNDGSMVGTPTQAEPRPVGGASDQVHGAGRLRVRQPHPGRAAEVERGHVDARRSPPARRRGPGPVRRHPTRDESTARAPTASVSSGAEGEVACRARSPTARPAAKASSAGGAAVGVGQRRRHHLGHAVEPDHPRLARRPGRRTGRPTIDADRACPVHPVGRGRVDGEAHVGVAASPRPARCSRRPRRRPAAATPCSTSSWAGITGAPGARLSVPIPRAR